MIYQSKTTPAATSAAYELSVIVGGKPIAEYQHEGNTFVEGRKGSDFQVEFKNKTAKQVLVVPSVDGKSIFDKSPATADSRGYVIAPWQTVRIPGWTLDNNSVANFVFDDKEKSYAVQTAEPDEKVQSGVIGVLVFSEKAKPAPVVINHHHYEKSMPRGPILPGTPIWPNVGPTWVGSAADVPYNANDLTAKSVMRSMNNTATLSASASAQSDSHENTAAADPFEMGTGFGSKADFKTTMVTFERDKQEAALIIYYDSRRNLQARGIEVIKKPAPSKDLPQAFGGMGCIPPKDWQG